MKMHDTRALTAALQADLAPRCNFSVASYQAENFFDCCFAFASDAVTIASVFVALLSILLLVSVQLGLLPLLFAIVLLGYKHISTKNAADLL